MKRILGIVASPRKLGNSEILAKAAIEATGADNQAEMIRLTDLDIKACKACYACLPKEAPCVIKDHLPFLLDRIRHADAIVLAAPCYFLGPHSAVKIFTDRLLSVGSKYKQYAGKPCITITTYGRPGWDGYAEVALNLTARFLNLELMDSASFLGANPAEVLEDPVNLKRARQLGQALVDSGYQRISKANECPVCWSTILQYEGDTIRCPFCGTTGEMRAEGEKVRPVFDPKENHLFSEEARREHFDVFLKRKKQEFLAKRQYYRELQNPYRFANQWISPGKNK